MKALKITELQNLWVTEPEVGQKHVQVFRSRSDARKEARIWRLSGYKAKVYQIPVYEIIPDQGP